VPATGAPAEAQRGAGATYLYGLTWSGRGGASGRGIADAAVRTIEHGELAAIVSPVEPKPLPAKRRDLLRHSDVLQAAFTAAPVLPFRFGTVLASDEAVLDELLTARYEELVGLLQRFEGLSELRLRAVFVEEAILAEIVRDDARIAALRAATRAAGTAGAHHVELGESVAHALADRRAAAGDEIVASLVGHALDVHVDEQRDELEIARASFLVEERARPKLERAAEGLAERHRGRIAFDLIGPMPPHSFVVLTRGGGA